MPRRSTGPSYEGSKRRWVANLGGRKTVLLAGVDDTPDTRRLAEKEYHRLAAADATQDASDDSPAGAVLNEWVVWLKTREDPPPVAPSTLEIYSRLVQSFADMHGRVKVRDLRPAHFDRWLAAMSAEGRKEKRTGRKLVWNAGTRKMAMAALRSAFRWASTWGGLIKTDPFRIRGERPQGKRSRYRSPRLDIEDAEYRLLAAHCLGRRHKEFGYLLLFLYATGARPAEMHQAKAKEWDEGLKAFVIEATEENVGRYKLARYGHERTVYVPDDLVPLARELMKKHPVGPIFRERGGGPITQKALCRHFRLAVGTVNRVAGREVVRKGLTTYSLRHAYVTRWVQAGGDVHQLAVLLNTSVAMIEKHYSHLFRKHHTLREAMRAMEEKQRSG